MEDKYLQDISDIKNMMNRSTQFISLSGLSGILAGVYALIGAYIGHELIQNHDSNIITLESNTFKMLVLTAFSVLFLSVGTALMLTINKAKKEGGTAWNSSSKRMLINFLIPLITGGVFGLLLLRKCKQIYLKRCALFRHHDYHNRTFGYRIFWIWIRILGIGFRTLPHYLWKYDAL